MKDDDFDRDADEYLNSVYEFGRNSNGLYTKAQVRRAYIDGKKTALKELREDVIKIFANGDDNWGELWRTCGLRLVGWDYEHNKPDDAFNVILDLKEAIYAAD